MKRDWISRSGIKRRKDEKKWKARIKTIKQTKWTNLDILIVRAVPPPGSIHLTSYSS